MKLTSLQRVLTAVSHKEPDYVPLFLLLTMHGAKELNMSIEKYFSDSKNVIEGQLLLREKYDNDCMFNFYYAGIEIEAFGGAVEFKTDGPANSAKPIIADFSEISKLPIIDPKSAGCLQKVYESSVRIKEKIGDDAPIIGVVMSPFSVPVMQLGFSKYIELMNLHPERFADLMRINEEFCIKYANAQIEAGATAICYFDPLASPDMVPIELYKKTGLEIAKRVISKINGPTAVHLASGRTIAIADLLPTTGTAIVGVSTSEDIQETKKAFSKKLTILGNLNGIKMRTWTPEIAEAKVKEILEKASPGGGFILSDNHGEIPFQVPDEVLLAISKAARKWGKYN